MGRVDSITAGLDGSVGRRDAMPPRSRITSRGSAAGSADNARKRSATAATTSADRPTSPCVEGSRSALPIASACALVESTSRRRLTTHQIRVGAVRRAGARSACDASHQTAISRQAVLPRPVGTPTSTRPFLGISDLRRQTRLPGERIAPVDRSIEPSEPRHWGQDWPIRRPGFHHRAGSLSASSSTGTQRPNPRCRPAPITTGP